MFLVEPRFPYIHSLWDLKPLYSGTLTNFWFCVKRVVLDTPSKRFWFLISNYAFHPTLYKVGVKFRTFILTVTVCKMQTIFRYVVFAVYMYFTIKIRTEHCKITSYIVFAFYIHFTVKIRTEHCKITSYIVFCILQAFHRKNYNRTL